MAPYSHRISPHGDRKLVLLNPLTIAAVFSESESGDQEQLQTCEKTGLLGYKVQREPLGRQETMRRAEDSRMKESVTVTSGKWLN